MANELLFDAEHLEEFTAAIFSACLMPEEHAAIVARALVSANLRGVDTHGVARIPAYVERLRSGIVNFAPLLSVASRMPWAASVDGDNAMGPVVGETAMAEALRRADLYGIGVATAKHSNHFGMASFYALKAVEQGCIGVSLSPASKSLAPFGSREPFFGTNPISVAVPAGKYAPWVMDMATSVAARGHIRLAARHGKPIPNDWALDAEGRPTTDPVRALAGVMLPFSGVKGSAIAMMIDILGGVLSGSAFGGEIRDMNHDFEAPQNVGHFFLAMKIEAFMPLAEFTTRMEAEISRLKSLKPAAGFNEVLYPGEPEARMEKRRRMNGIPLSPEVIESLKAMAADHAIDLPNPVMALDQRRI